MSRIRSIKPEFFLDEELAELSPLTRLLFVGLWTLADCEGRLEDRPKRIRAQLHPDVYKRQLPMSFRIATNQSIVLRLTASDRAQHAAPVENAVWSLADSALATLEAAADGMSAKISAKGAAGTVAGEVRAD